MINRMNLIHWYSTDIPPRRNHQPLRLSYRLPPSFAARSLSIPKSAICPAIIFLKIVYLENYYLRINYILVLECMIFFFFFYIFQPDSTTSPPFFNDPSPPSPIILSDISHIAHIFSRLKGVLPLHAVNPRRTILKYPRYYYFHARCIEAREFEKFLPAIFLSIAYFTHLTRIKSVLVEKTFILNFL